MRGISPMNGKGNKPTRDNERVSPSPCIKLTIWFLLSLVLLLVVSSYQKLPQEYSTNPVFRSSYKVLLHSAKMRSSFGKSLEKNIEKNPLVVA